MIGTLLNACAFSGRKTVADLSNTSPAQILAAVKHNQDRIKTLSGKGHLSIYIPGSPFEGNVKVRVKRPDSLYVLTEAAFGVDVGYLFADGRNFSSYSPVDNIHFEGPVEKMGSIVLFQLKLSYSQLLHTIIGTPHFNWSANDSISIKNNRYVFHRTRKKYDLVFQVDPVRTVITDIEVYNTEGQKILEQKFGRFKKIKGAWVPRRILLKKPHRNEMMSVYYTKVEINNTIPDALFEYKVPANAKLNQQPAAKAPGSN